MKARLLILATLAGLAAQTVQADTLTGMTGGNQPFSNVQPSLSMNEFIQVQGVYPSRDGIDGGSPGENVLGSIRTFAGSFSPVALANGQLQSISSNTALFSLLGTQYGGNGISSFALPDLRGTTMVGTGTGPGLSNWVNGQTGGSALTTLTALQMPAHVHSLPGGGSTGSAGGGQAVGNLQPSLGVSYVIATSGVFPPNGGGSTGGMPFLGQVSAFAGNFAPGGYAFADGSLLPINQYQALFAILGTTYGGNGQTTFALPDLRGRTIIGAGQGPGLSNRVLGQQVGIEQVTLNVGQIPVHDHTLPPNPNVTGNAGGNQPFDNMQPSLALNYLIATQGIFPSRDSPASGQTLLGEVTAFAGDYVPGGWQMADGSLLSISQNTALFSLLGTAYGGDGRTTFALPDLRGRTVVGALGDYESMGIATGTESVTLSVAQLAVHDHTVSLPVPEPETYAMMLAGLAMLAVVARRRRTG